MRDAFQRKASLQRWQWLRQADQVGKRGERRGKPEFLLYIGEEAKCLQLVRDLRHLVPRQVTTKSLCRSLHEPKYGSQSDVIVQYVTVARNEAKEDMTNEILLQLVDFMVPGGVRVLKTTSAFQVTPQKFVGRRIGPQPVAVQQEVVDFVGEDELLEVDALLAQGFGKLHGF